MIFAIPQVVRHKPTGDLLITVERYNATAHHGAGYRCSPIDNRYSSRGYADDDLEAAPPRKPGAFDFKTEIMPRIQGALPWGHVEAADLVHTLSNVAACAGWAAYSGIAWVTKPGEVSANWARIFLHTTQGGGYTGQAHALVWERGRPSAPAPLVDAVVKAAVRATHDGKAPPGDIAAAVLAMEAETRLRTAMPSAWLLSICKHEIVDSSTPAGRMRGWHPAHCSKCGINLSVDSSD
ncbi:MAG: hypothetical protein K9G48_12710 [Reyranella sp.]|nr:hypothetical protein [Reyranella sp.]